MEEINKKYYFIGWVHKKFGEFGRIAFYNSCIDKHPFEWQLEMQELYLKKNKLICDVSLYTLLFWREITEEEYKMGLKIEW